VHKNGNKKRLKKRGRIWGLVHKNGNKKRLKKRGRIWGLVLESFKHTQNAI